MTTRDELIRSMPAEDFRNYMTIDKQEAGRVAVVVALILNGRYKDKNFLRTVRDLLELEASMELQKALEDGSY